MRQFSVEALTELGYRVMEADGAEAALQLLDAHPEIALLFTDIVMPEMNGAKLAEEARAAGRVSRCCSPPAIRRTPWSTTACWTPAWT